MSCSEMKISSRDYRDTPAISARSNSAKSVVSASVIGYLPLEDSHSEIIITII